MPLAEWESTGDPGYGTGLEALGFSASWPEVAQWWSAHSRDIPPVMTAASLREAGVTPQVLAVMRAIARGPLLRDKSIGGLPMPLRGGTPSGIVDVLDYIRTEGWHPGFDGHVWFEERDAGRTKDFVIPVTPKLHVIVNQTWGVRWRYVTEDPFVNRQYPQLAEPEQHDASQRPSGVLFRRRYIPPDELGAITKERVVDAYQLAFDIGALVSVFRQDDSIVKIGLGRISGGVFCPFSRDYSELTIFTNSDTAGALTLRLGLSHQNGSRYVAFTAENEEVYKVEGQIRAFYDPRPRPSLYAEPG